MEQVAVGDQGQALPPRRVRRREVGADVVVLAEDLPDALEELVPNQVRELGGELHDLLLGEQNLPAHDLVGPLLGDVELPEGVGQLVTVWPGDEVGR